MTIKHLALAAMRAAGLNHIARRITRRGLRILCYHGISLSDEHDFNPMLFMRAEVFHARIQKLRELQLPVIELDEALFGRYPDGAVVITFDDGWAGTEVALNILRRYHYPATVYVTSYYAETQTQVFNVLVRYLAWKTPVRIVLPNWDLEHGCLRDPTYLRRVLEKGESLDSLQRQAFAYDLCNAVGSPDSSKLFRLMSLDALRTVAAAGFDVQLHTHRHDFRPDDAAWNEREIRQNRAVLEAISHRPLRHLCYPSGRYGPEQFGSLQNAGIVTAVTTNRGINYLGQHPLALSRFLDSEAIDSITFEAELCGLWEMLRRPQRLFSSHSAIRMQ